MLSKFWFRALLIVVIAIIIYSFMLSASFRVLDDENSILNNSLIHDTTHIKEIFTQGVFKDQTYYRPLVNLSFMGEYHFFGATAFYYYYDNLCLHILNAFLVWAVVGLILNNLTLGFFSGLLFVLHPIQAEAVNNISGRAILLGGFFALSSLAFFLLYEHAWKKKFLIASLVSFAAGLLCKESVAVLPGVLFLYVWLRQKDVSKILPFVAAVGIYIGLRASLGIIHTFAWADSSQAALGFISFLRSLITGIRELFMPLGLYFDRSQRLFMSFADVQAMATIVFWLAAAAGLWLKRQQVPRIAWFFIGWFVLEMLPVAQIIHAIGVAPGMISTADHFLYIACVPIFALSLLIIKTFLEMNTTRQWVKKEIIYLGLGALLGFFALTTIEQNIYASNEQAMLTRSVEHQPFNGRVQSSLGLLYARKGQFTQAEEHFAMAMLASPHNPRYQIALAKSICDQGRYAECLKIYNQIDKPGEFAKLLEDNKRVAQQFLEQR